MNEPVTGATVWMFAPCLTHWLCFLKILIILLMRSHRKPSIVCRRSVWLCFAQNWPIDISKASWSATHWTAVVFQQSTCSASRVEMKSGHYWQFLPSWLARLSPYFRAVIHNATVITSSMTRMTTMTRFPQTSANHCHGRLFRFFVILVIFVIQLMGINISTPRYENRQWQRLQMGMSSTHWIDPKGNW